MVLVRVNLSCYPPTSDFRLRGIALVAFDPPASNKLTVGVLEGFSLGRDSPDLITKK